MDINFPKTKNFTLSDSVVSSLYYMDPDPALQYTVSQIEYGSQEPNDAVQDFAVTLA